MPIVEQLDGFGYPGQKSHLSPEEAETITQTGIIIGPLAEGIKIFTARSELPAEATPFLFQTVRVVLSLIREQESMEDLGQTCEKYPVEEGDFLLCLFPSKDKNRYLLALTALRIQHSQGSFGVSLYPLAVLNSDKTLSKIAPENQTVWYDTIPAKRRVALAIITFKPPPS